MSIDRSGNRVIRQICKDPGGDLTKYRDQHFKVSYFKINQYVYFNAKFLFSGFFNFKLRVQHCTINNKINKK